MPSLASYHDRALRWLFVASVVTSATIGVAWGLSYRWSVSLYHTSLGGLSEIRMHRGSVMMRSIDSATTAVSLTGVQIDAAASVNPWDVVSPTQKRAVADSSILGFSFYRMPDQFEIEEIPAWAVLAGLGVFQAWWWARRRGRFVRWTPSGTCIGCGYDMRGRADCCPECGREIGHGRVEALPARRRPPRARRPAVAH